MTPPQAVLGIRSLTPQQAVLGQRSLTPPQAVLGQKDISFTPCHTFTLFTPKRGKGAYPCHPLPHTLTPQAVYPLSGRRKVRGMGRRGHRHCSIAFLHRQGRS